MVTCTPSDRVSSCPPIGLEESPPPLRSFRVNQKVIKHRIYSEVTHRLLMLSGARHVGAHLKALWLGDGGHSGCRHGDTRSAGGQADILGQGAGGHLVCCAAQPAERGQGSAAKGKWHSGRKGFCWGRRGCDQGGAGAADSPGNHSAGCHSGTWKERNVGS